MKNISLIFGAFLMVIGIAALDVAAQTEIQQQLNDVSSTLDNAATQIESIKQKGVVQTVWDNITAPLAGIWQQVLGILSQIGSIVAAFGK